jgi:hypothetical protein
MIPSRLLGNEFGMLFGDNFFGLFLQSWFFEDGEAFALIDAGLDEVDALHD